MFTAGSGQVFFNILASLNLAVHYTVLKTRDVADLRLSVINYSDINSSKHGLSISE
jgi:hypothetical protein